MCHRAHATANPKSCCSPVGPFYKRPRLSYTQKQWNFGLVNEFWQTHLTCTTKKGSRGSCWALGTQAVLPVGHPEWDNFFTNLASTNGRLIISDQGLTQASDMNWVPRKRLMNVLVQAMPSPPPPKSKSQNCNYLFTQQLAGKRPETVSVCQLAIACVYAKL